MDPAAAYRGQMWDWDSYFCALALIDIYGYTADYIKGCVLNSTEYAAEDGSIPYVIEAYPRDPKQSSLPPADRSPRTVEKDYNSIKPLLSQMSLLASERTGDFSWISDIYEVLENYIAHWEKTQRASNGLFVWRSHRGSGTDNHPAVYIMFEGLLKYGFYDDALKVAECILKTLTDDIMENGLLHEFYNHETGKSTMLQGFKNWNALAASMLPKLRSALSEDEL